ncbi:glycosyltransferase family 39 protein, partial [Streptomyces sp. B1866]|uniref:glycosyltransferase family 39 protein n=1 Tax=Streptomyces sp. B1866 TaxID=3075431 RepID=UPI00288DC6FB
MLAYASARLLGLVTLLVWSAAAGTSAHRLLSDRWDAVWYARIAADGYGRTVRLPDGAVHSDLAFFPLLPWLERLIAAASPLGEGDAGLVVSAVASVAAAWGLFAVGDLLHGRRAGVALAALWGVLPVAVVQSMAYSESLFTALAVWSLHAVLTGRWVRAGALAALAGLTRPVGMAVVAAVWCGAAAALRRRRAGPGPGGGGRAA